jgi:hypothetical protein
MISKALSYQMRGALTKKIYKFFSVFSPLIRGKGAKPFVIYEEFISFFQEFSPNPFVNALYFLTVHILWEPIKAAALYTDVNLQIKMSKRP